MTAAVWTSTSRLSSVAGVALNKAARLWFVVAVLGQWAFALFVTLLYGASAVPGNFAGWNKRIPHAYVPGEPIGNLAIVLHLLLAVVTFVGGPLQFVPQIRQRLPILHRWTGRLYIPAMFLISLGGLYLVWVRGTIGDVSQHLGVSLDAVLIMTFAALALRYALARDFRTHRQWALRLFMAANGVWFFRIGMAFWLFINGGPAGFDKKTYSGPFLTIWSFADYLLPLIVLELYLRAKTPGARLATATIILVLTVVMGMGIYLAATRMWLPRL